MKRLLLILALFVPAVAAADVFPHYGWCQYGGQTVTVQGLSSTGDVQASYPGCAVEVFASGTSTHANLFSDAAGTSPLANPFTADTGTGYYTFYTAQGCYDIVTSGASIPAPHTDTICLASSTSTGTVTSVSSTNNAGALITVGVTNPTTTPDFTFGLTQFAAHSFWGNATGSLATPSATVITTGDLPFTYSGNTTVLVTAGTISGTGSALCTDASGNATTSGCPSSYRTVQDEGVSLTQRSTINFTGAGISCSDLFATTTCNVSGASGVTGTLSTNFFPIATGVSTIADSPISLTGGGQVVNIASTVGRIEMQAVTGNPTGLVVTGITGSGAGEQLWLESAMPGVAVGDAKNAYIQIGGGAADGSSGNIVVNTGSPSVSTGNVGNITLQTGTKGVSGNPGQIRLKAIGGKVQLDDGSDLTLQLGAGTGMFLQVGSGAPSGTCSVNTLYFRTDGSATNSTFMYVCMTGTSSWTAVTVP